MTTSFYTRTGSSSFESSELAVGPWNSETQHAGPPAALLVRAIEQQGVAVGGWLGRVAVDILAPVPVDHLDIAVRILRLGKRVALLEAAAARNGDTVMIARGWWLAPVAAKYPAPPPIHPRLALIPPDRPADLPGARMDGYMSAIDWRFEHGDFARFGPSKAWARPWVTLLDGEPLSAWQRTMIVADSASGVSLVAHPRTHPAINCDLTVVQHRDPLGEWICLDATTTVSPGSGALTSAHLSDQYGPTGESLQTLLAWTE